MKELNIKIDEKIGQCLVTLDGKPVGLIQSIKVELDVKESSPKVEIVFPDLREYGIQLQSDLASNLQDLSDMPHVSVSFRKLDPIAVAAKTEPVAQWSATDIPEDPKDLKDPRDE